MHDFYFHGIWRMDWGLGNPNKTATLIAMLMIAVWALAYLKRWGFWVAWVLFMGLGVCLIHTFSRGGLVALISGVAILLWRAPRPWAVSRVAAVLIAIWLLVGTAVHLQAHQRFGQGIVKEDRSITNRLKIWKQVPQMMVAAPNGWGRDQAQWAYMQWFQSVNASESYVNLVSSHFTWMVEMGWLGRFAYVAGWGFVFLLSWPTGSRRWLALPLAVCVSFAVGAVFTHVADSSWLWILPGLALLSVLGGRAWQKSWPQWSAWGGVTGAAGLMLLAVWAIGTARSTLPLRGSEGTVVIGRGEPGVWIVADSKVLGDNYGKTLRRFIAEQKDRTFPTVAVVDTLEDIKSKTPGTIVVAGSLPEEELHALAVRMQKGTHILFLNPTFYPQEIGALEDAQRKNMAAIFGEFSQSPALSAWQSFATVRQVEVAGDFLPRWPELILPPAS
ncbi:MAG: O-antigen ligase family protein [Chthoniobacter sp.]|nr:O-antigen ligase family protein [Chthoniobacter sp.]